jgi:quercetin dioxygenase-like cupin family protein
MSAAEFVTNRAELPTESFEWGTLQWLANGNLLPGAAQTLGLCHIHAGRRNPLHFHPNCEEVLHVLSGYGEHALDDQKIELAPGMTIRIPQGAKHNLANTGLETLVCLIAFSSGDRQTVFLE